MAVSLASAFIRLRPQVDRSEFKKEGEQAGKQAGESAGEEFGEGYKRGADGKLRDSRGKFVKDSEAMGGLGGSRAGKAFGIGFGKGAGGTGAFGAALATTAARLTLFGSAAAAAAPGVVHLTAALLPATGALAVMPAALLAVKAASAVTRVAVEDVGEAISAGFGDDPKKAAEALKQLSGSARVFATEVIGLQENVNGLKGIITENFFQPLVGAVQPLGEIYFPLLRTEAGALSGQMGGLAREVANTAQQSYAFGAVRDLLRGTSGAAGELRGAVAPLAEGFGNLISVTSAELPGLSAGFTRLATDAGAWLTQASQDGRVIAAFGRAKAVIGDLAAILVNIGSIITSVFQAAAASGGDILGNFRLLTAQAADFLNSVQGMSALGAIFGTLAQFGAALRTSLGAVLPAVAESIEVLGPAIAGLAGPAGQLVVAVAPLLPLLAGITATVVTALTPAIAAISGYLAENEGVVKGLVIALTAYLAIQKVVAAFVAVQAAGGLIKYIASLKVVTVLTRAFTAVQAALNVVLRLNPIGLIITALVALGAAVVLAYQKSETFRTIVQGAWKGIQQAVSFAWNNVIKPAVMALVGYFQNVIAPAALFLWRNVFQPAWKGIQFAVKAAWVVIQIIFKAFQNYLQNVLIPIIRFLYNNVVRPVFSALATFIKANWEQIIKPVFSALRTAFSFLGDSLRNTWTGIIKPVFSALVGFIGDYVVKGFRKAVDTIGKAWEGLKNAAKVPIKFVVDTAINPLINGINKVAKFVGVKDEIPPIKGFASGGQIPGAPSLKDNRIARGPNGLLAVASGEYITNTKSTMANLGLVKAINNKRGKVTRDDVDPYLDGGGQGDGFGDFFGKLSKGFSGAVDLITNPKAALTKVANAALDRIPGSGPLVGMLAAMGRKLVSSIGSFLSDKLGGSIGGRGVAGGWRGMQRLISAQFPGLGLISGFRPGARTLSGNQSYHALGRAVDYPPNRALAAWIKANFGKQTKELITPFQELNLRNGRPKTYTGPVWNQHNFAGGNAHVHWAAELGGLIGRMTGLPFGSYDRGGLLPRGLSIAHNGTGRPEPVGHGIGLHVHFHNSVVASEEQAVDLMVGAYNTAVRQRRITPGARR